MRSRAKSSGKSWAAVRICGIASCSEDTASVRARDIAEVGKEQYRLGRGCSERQSRYNNGKQQETGERLTYGVTSLY